MAGSASEQLAQRYALQLSPAWQAWFDQDAGRSLLAGQFRAPVAMGDLLKPTPPDLWPGFMLPDTLPLVGNDYGDWWCMRIGSDNQISEIVQWQHGGGDWLPVGRTIAEAGLWDAIHRSHDLVIGAQAAAHEYPQRMRPTQAMDPVVDSAQRELENWLSHGLGASQTELGRILQQSASGQYRAALEQLVQRDWATHAAACELIEVALQGSLKLLADPKLADRCGIDWTPEYTSWLFDTQRIPDAARRMLREFDSAVEFGQDWEAAGQRAVQTLARRSDLSWAGDVAGWAAERAGDVDRAIDIYFANRATSAFTDQSVRLRSHWFGERFGKFCSAQLARLKNQLSGQQSSDSYLQILWNEPVPRMRAAIRDFWLAQAKEAVRQQAYAEAYSMTWNAGWDLGAERLSDYLEILDGLASTARSAGWTARAVVAATHAECLRSRLPTH